ncbi:signal peptidase I [Yinghuangia seranimata]|uniref:signal peptidase I n=1 Tax=Yinghuangia seranimata TaxID=408067 RepID=UPI00248B9AC7|nr:signal peptidase I [Yinghuangia seranimata]MDI2130031.1 signal peptidase I [Yinghuangia seranimata]
MTRGRTWLWFSRAAYTLSGVLVVVPMVVLMFTYAVYSIPSNSMEPTLWGGDRVVVHKGADVGRGDVIVFTQYGWSPTAHEFVKRVVGVGGDKVACCDAAGLVTVNGKPVRETYLAADELPSRTGFEVTVPQGRLFVLGDFRSVSLDSRTHLLDPTSATVARSDVVGRVEYIVWPLSRQQSVPGSDAFRAAGVPGGGAPDGPAALLAYAIVAGLVLSTGTTLWWAVATIVLRVRGRSGGGGPGVAPVPGGDADEAVEPPHG